MLNILLMLTKNFNWNDPNGATAVKSESVPIPLVDLSLKFTVEALDLIKENHSASFSTKFVLNIEPVLNSVDNDVTAHASSLSKDIVLNSLIVCGSTLKTEVIEEL